MTKSIEIYVLIAVTTLLAVCSGMTRTAQANVYMNVASASQYTLVYSLALPNTAAFNSQTIPYSVNASAGIANGSFSRIAYYLELQTASGALKYAFASMNAFTTDASKVGVPNTASGEFYQQHVANMDVVSNVAGVVNGTAIATGSLEFWHTNYNTQNSANVPGANGNTYDWGDQPVTGGSYGSMQINNYGASQTIIAYNDWGASGSSQSDVGIGNQSSGNPDWTFAANAAGYTVKNLQVLVLQASVPEPASLLLLAPGLAGLAMLRRRKPQAS